ncbi:MAG TPA: flagellar basal body rod protein FlgC [Planctomycetota bacterium]
MNVSSIDISASGMRAQRLRMDLIAGNLANVDTTSARRETRKTAEGVAVTRHVPYARKLAVFTAGPSIGGVPSPAARVVEDDAPFRRELNPSHPHADASGMVEHPNVHPIAEMVDMIAASRAYEANVSAMDTAKAMAAASLRILA